MMDDDLTVWTLLQHASRHHPRTEIVTRDRAGLVARHSYPEMATRSQQLMHALDGLGLATGSRIATLAWNHHRHLEAYFAVPCTERVLHTVNVRLSSDDLAFVMSDADDEVVLVDPDLLPALVAVVDQVPSLRHVVVLVDHLDADIVDPAAVDALASAGRTVHAYEELLAGHPTTYPRRAFDERTVAGLCYTSGTTGRPKGVEYTHRSTVLHALVVTTGSAMSFGPSDTVLPQVPMFHAAAWGMPHAAVAVGAQLVLFSGALDAGAFVDTLRDERVTVTAAVPTVWIAVADELAARGGGLPDLRNIFCGGAQPPRPLIERYRREFAITIVQLWGMTETSPLASAAWPQAWMRDWSDEAILDACRTKAGLPLPGVEVDIRAEDGSSLPFDGETMGDLHVRGPWVVDHYLGGAGTESFTVDGWFRTGDVAIGTPDGYFVIADRTKDLIKSGGEWISSVDMEAALMALPAVVEAAVIAVPDPKWLERPLACIVVQDDATLDVATVRAHLEAHGFARWQLPERIELIDVVPRTGVGKFDKVALRARFARVSEDAT